MTVHGWEEACWHFKWADALACANDKALRSNARQVVRAGPSRLMRTAGWWVHRDSARRLVRMP